MDWVPVERQGRRPKGIMNRTIAIAVTLLTAATAAAQDERDERASTEAATSRETRADTPSRPAAHELTHTVQQRAPAETGGATDDSRQGIRHQQGRVLTDADDNEQQAPRPAPSMPLATPARPVDADTANPPSPGPVPTPYPNVSAPSAQNPFLPEVDDEVLVAFEQGDYVFDGEYYVVKVTHRAPLRLPAGSYRTPGGRTFTLRGGEVDTER